jgi:DNA polymerase-3 subunit alpha
MKVSVDFAGFTNAQADSLRKAMGKKNPEAMAKMEALFVDGAVAKSCSIEATLEDGSVVKVPRLKKFKCTDGQMRTVEETVADGAEIISFSS